MSERDRREKKDKKKTWNKKHKSQSQKRSIYKHIFFISRSQRNETNRTRDHDNKKHLIKTK